jgi:hypothetical protein
MENGSNTPAVGDYTGNAITNSLFLRIGETEQWQKQK